MKAHIFNPDTEMALAVGAKSYTPPVAVQRFITRLSCIPALYACPGDAIIVPAGVRQMSDGVPYLGEVAACGLHLVTMKEVGGMMVEPWGWNLALRNSLASAGVPECNLPTEASIIRLRNLAHRKTTISILRRFGFGEDLLPLHANEAGEVAECIRRFEKEKQPYVVKLPLSSSGRGVFFSPGVEMATRACNRGHGVMIEPQWDKVLDFATEWRCDAGKVTFLGYSVFTSTGHGNYASNIVASQEYLERHILRYCSADDLKTSESLLMQVLAEIVAPYYEGVLGVDMLCDKSGRINPCVELNLRRTMGHVALALYERNRPSVPCLFSPGLDFPVSAGKF